MHMPAVGWPTKILLPPHSFRIFGSTWQPARQVVFLPPKSGIYHLSVPQPPARSVPRDLHTGKCPALRWVWRGRRRVKLVDFPVSSRRITPRCPATVLGLNSFAGCGDVFFPAVAPRRTVCYSLSRAAARDSRGAGSIVQKWLANLENSCSARRMGLGGAGARKGGARRKENNPNPMQTSSFITRSSRGRVAPAERAAAAAAAAARPRAPRRRTGTPSRAADQPSRAAARMGRAAAAGAPPSCPRGLRAAAPRRTRRAREFAAAGA